MLRLPSQRIGLGRREHWWSFCSVNGQRSRQWTTDSHQERSWLGKADVVGYHPSNGSGLGRLKRRQCLRSTLGDRRAEPGCLPPGSFTADLQTDAVGQYAGDASCGREFRTQSKATAGRSASPGEDIAFYVGNGNAKATFFRHDAKAAGVLRPVWSRDFETAISRSRRCHGGTAATGPYRSLPGARHVAPGIYPRDAPMPRVMSRTQLHRQTDPGSAFRAWFGRT